MNRVSYLKSFILIPILTCIMISGCTNRETVNNNSSDDSYWEEQDGEVPLDQEVESELGTLQLLEGSEENDTESADADSEKTISSGEDDEETINSEDDLEDVNSEEDFEQDMEFEEAVDVDTDDKELDSVNIDEVLDSMTLEEKVAQLFMITPEALTGTDTVTAFGSTSQSCYDLRPVGGIIYFSKNLQNPDQTGQMLENAQNYAMSRNGIPLFLGVDEEGGRVLRIGSNAAFGVEKVGAMQEITAQGGEAAVLEAAETIGSYLSELGFNLDFAPVADVLTNPDNTAIGDRAFSSDPEVVAQMAGAYAKGLKAHNVMAVYKHFPGHGDTLEDTHEGYAYSNKTVDELSSQELIPFSDGAEGAADMIMAAHISLPKITGDDTPASLSRAVVTDILRKKIGYDGVVITDSLGMGAISEHYSSEQSAVLAIKAGCDMILMPADFESAYQSILAAVKNGEISQERINESVYRILKLKLR